MHQSSFRLAHRASHRHGSHRGLSRFKQAQRRRRQQNFKPQIETLEKRLVFAAVSWISNFDGFWDEPSNWSGARVPDSNDDVTIDLPNSDPKITIRDGRTVKSLVSRESVLVAGGGALRINEASRIEAGTFTMQGDSLVTFGLQIAPTATLDWQAGFLGAQNFVNDGTMQINGANNRPLGGTITNRNVIEHRGNGSVLLDGGSKIIVEADGVYNLMGDGGIRSSGNGGGSTPNLQFAGTLRKSAGNGTSEIDLFLNTTQTFKLEGFSGRLRLAEGGLIRGAQVQAGAAGTMELGGDQTFFISGTVTGRGNGRFELTAPVISSVDGEVASAHATLDFEQGLLHWLSGTIASGGCGSSIGCATTLVNAGFMSIEGDVAKGISGSGLINEGTLINVGSGMFFTNGSTLENRSGAIFEHRGDSPLTGTDQFGNAGRFINAGTFIKSQGSGSVSWDIRLNNRAGGAIEVASGRLRFTRGGDMTGGQFNIAAGAVLELGGTQDVFNATGTYSGNGAGLLEINRSFNGTSEADPAKLQFNSGPVKVIGGELLGYLVNDGIVDIAVSAGLFVRATITNNGTWIHSGAGDLVLNANSRFVNAGLVDLRTDADLVVPGDQSGGIMQFINSPTGRLLKSNGLGTSSLRHDGSGKSLQLDNLGTVEVRSGSLELQDNVVQFSSSTLVGGKWIVGPFANLLVNSAANVVINQATVQLDGPSSNFPRINSMTTNQGSFTLTGGRDFSTAGNLTNSGRIDVGPDSHLRVNGNLSQTGTLPPSIVIQVGGRPRTGEFGSVRVTGQLQMAGQLNIVRTDGFGPTPGDTYSIFQYASRTGAFTINGTAPYFDAIVSPTEIQLTTRADAPVYDLAVSAIQIPAGSKPGQLTTIGYTVTNQSSNALGGSWIDSIYLSKDASYSADDLLVGRVDHVGGVAANSTYSESLTAPMPAVVDGSYFVLVRADSRGVVPDTNRGNNLLAATATLPITSNPLTSGVATNGSIANGQDIYYRLDVPAGGDVSISLALQTTNQAEFYVSYRQVPTRSSFDFVANDPAELNRLIKLASVQGGSYYILIHGREGAGQGTNFQIQPQVVSFGIDSFTPSRGANVGNVTTTITGSGFTPSTVVQLVDGAGTTVTTALVRYSSANELYATFNLLGVPLGNYSVRVVSSNNVTSQRGPFAVFAGVAGVVTTNLTTPGTIRAGNLYQAVIDYANVGDTDVSAPLLFINATNANLRLHGDVNFVGSTMQLLGISSQGPAGILPPGARGQFLLQFVPSDAVDFELQTLTNPAADSNWDAVKQKMKPGAIPDDAWELIFTNYKNAMGSTAGQFQSVLSQLATYLGQIGLRSGDVELLKQIALVNAGANGDIARRFYLGPLGRGIETPWDLRLIEESSGTVEIRNGTSIRSFVKLSNGSYVDLEDFTSSLTKVGNSFRLRQPNGVTIVFRADGLLEAYEDTLGGRITANYTGNRLIGFTDSDGRTSTYRYNAQGRIDLMTDPFGRTTTLTYDASGEHLTSVTNALGTTTYSYFPNPTLANSHAVRSVMSPDGRSIFYEYDSVGRLTRVSRDGNEELGRINYGPNGEVLFDRQSSGSTQLKFSPYGPLAQVIDTMGGVASVAPSRNQRPGRVTSAAGTTETFSYGAQNIITGAVDQLGNEFNLNIGGPYNRLLSTRDAKGSQVGYAYNALGQLTSITYNDGTTELFEFDSEHRISRMTNRRGQSVIYGTNSDGLIISETHSDGLQVTYEYDNHQNRTRITETKAGVTQVTQLGYDAADRLTKVTYPNGRFIEVTLDAVGRRTMLRDNSGYEAHYAYDQAGRLQSVSDKIGQELIRYTFDGLDRLVQETKSNGTTTAYSYDAAGRTTQIVHRDRSGNTIASFAYEYDQLNRRSSVTTAQGKTNYGYDAAGQLTRVALPNGRTIEYQYDATGNRVAVRDSGVETTYAANALDQVTRIGSDLLTYDLDGNLISHTRSTGTTTYAYDPRGRLIDIQSPGNRWQYEYDALGNRSAVIHNGVRTEYLIDPFGLSNIVAEFDSNGALQSEYIYGLGLTARSDDGSQHQFYNYDANFNAIQLTDAQGNIANSYSYLPSGELLNATEAIDNPFTFNARMGIVDDGNGLYFHRERWMAPSQGRFIQPDPLGISGGHTNLYDYANNAPTNKTDATGLSPDFAARLLELANRIEAGLELQSWGATKGAGAVGVGLMEDLEMSGFLKAMQAEAELEASIASQLAKGATEATSASTGTIAKAIAEANAIEARNLAGMIKLIALRDAQFALRKLVAEAVISFGVSLLADLAGSAIINATEPTIEAEKHRNDPLGPLGNPDFGKRSREILKDCLAEIASGEISDRCFRVKRAIALARSQDPNEIVGPSLYVMPDQTLPYTIHFENLATASAPAVEVEITQQLDADLDWSTFQLGDMGFGSTAIEVSNQSNARLSASSPITHSYHTQVLLPASGPTGGADLLVDVQADLDLNTGIVTWLFTALDPLTGDLPADALAGFLPPNTVSPIGQGFVNYTIRLKPGVSSGTRIDAKASIIFDTNDPLETAPIFSIVDALAPVSSVNILPATTYTRQFTVSWSGADEANGSGLAGFDVYLSTDNGPYELWLANTTLTSKLFDRSPLHSYAFYVIAKDVAGHVESVASVPDAFTYFLGPPWYNFDNPLDVDASGRVVPLDALLVINEINVRSVSAANGALPLTVQQPQRPAYDVNGDNFVTPLDALLLINFLNTQVGREGESAEITDSATTAAAHDQFFSGLPEVDPFTETPWQNRRRARRATLPLL